MLTEVTTSVGDSARDVVDFELGAPDVAGLLRAERPGNRDAVYVLAYTAHDLAGNTADCSATVVVAHDQRR